MAGIRMNAPKTEVKSISGGTDNEWQIFETEAGYEYNSNLETFDPERNWSLLDSDKKKQSIDRIESKCNQKNIKWGGSVAEWKLHSLHKSAMKTKKNHEKRQASSATKPFKNDCSPTQPGSSRHYDPVKDAAKDREQGDE